MRLAQPAADREGADRDARPRRADARRSRSASDRHEAHWVAGTIADALAAGVAPTEILLLARTGYATRPTHAALAAAGIPHRVLGSLGLYERSEVRDALAYLALLANPADAQAFRRAVQSPRRGIGMATANRVVALARDRARRRPDRRQRPRARARARSARPRRASGSPRFGAELDRVRERAARPGDRSATSSSPR